MGSLLLESSTMEANGMENGKKNVQKTKTRRSQRKKKIWRETKIMMVNMRGYKGKQNSIKEIVAENQPTILLLMETLCKKEEINIEGYKIHPTKKRSDMWGGILFAVPYEIENNIQITNESVDEAEIMFAQIKCGRMLATIGLVYAPQEKDTPVEQLDKMYKYIESEVMAARAGEHIVLLGGDFNCKIGDQINGNKKEVTTGGRRLKKLAVNNGMTIINTTDKCKGLWTRSQIEKGIQVRSVLDYFLITEEHEHLVKSMIIDEEKMITPFRDDSQPGKPIYTDHHMMTLNLNLSIPGREPGIRISRKKMEKFTEATENTQLTHIVQNSEKPVNEIYKQWNDETLNIVKQVCGRKKKSKNELKEIRLMRQKRRRLKEQMKKERNMQKRIILDRRRKMIQQHIVRRRRYDNKQKVITIANDILNKGIFNRTAYWDFSRAMKGKKKYIKGRSVNDKEGNRLDDPVKVKERYKEFYRDLLTTKEAETEDERKIEAIVNKCIAQMMLNTEDVKIQPMTDEEYEEMKKSLKKNKSPDMQGWFYEIIIHAGKDLENSIKLMINKVLEQKFIPEEWNIMGILPIDKTASWLEMKEKRGLFLTNIISKCVEKVLFKRREKALKENISPFQNGGTQGRAIQDNLFIKNHIIHKYKKEKKNLYLLYADIEKCFDNLWLKDCILELVRSGTPVEEAMFIYKMNQNIQATVRTPVGETEPIKLEEIVRQGTVGGNKLCIVSTDRINRMGSYIEKDGVRYPIFVDDKLGIGEPETIQEMCWKMNTLEVTKKYTYNTKKGKTEWMMIKNNRKSSNEIELDLEVKNGKIGRTKQYKYHGDMYDDTGRNLSKIKHKESKLGLMVNDIKTEACEKKIGRAALNVRLMLMEVVITPTVLCSTETWHEITKLEKQQINKMHHRILTETLNLPRTTPYMGIISELNILPFMDNVWFKKFMWYHQLLNSEDERAAKKVLLEQMKENDNWYTELKEYADAYGICIEKEMVENVTYERYKNLVRQCIESKVVTQLKEEKETKTKMRWINPGKRQNYITSCSIRDAGSILKLRLHMVKVKANYGGGTCRKCDRAEETTEHVIQCMSDGRVEAVEEVEDVVEDIGWLKRTCKVFEQFETLYG